MPEIDPIENAFYCTEDDVRLIAELRKSELSDDRVRALIEKAQAEIDAQLASTLPVPFTLGDVPAKIRFMCADLAASFVLMKVYIGTAPNQSPYGDTLFTRVMAQMQRIREGIEQVVDSAGADVSGIDNVLVTTPNRQAIFTRGSYKDATLINVLEDFGLDSAEAASFFNLGNFFFILHG